MNTNLSGRELRDEVTPFSLYANRRRFMQGLGAVGTLAASAGVYRWFNPVRSTNAMIRKLGPGRWKLLHRLAYVAAVLGVVTTTCS